jgi:hypothetical protein
VGPTTDLIILEKRKILPMPGIELRLVRFITVLTELSGSKTCGSAFPEVFFLRNYLGLANSEGFPSQENA